MCIGLEINFRLDIILSNLIKVIIGEEGGGFRMGNTCIPVADSF